MPEIKLDNEFSLIKFMKALQKVNFINDYGNKCDLFNANDIIPEVRIDTNIITISAEVAWNNLSIETIVKVHKVCREFEIDECLLNTQSRERLLFLIKKYN